MTDTYIEIKNDLFDVVSELKRTDDGYSVVYNRRRGRFEVHHARCRPTLQLVLPYKELDYRSVLHVKRTRTERMTEELCRMDEENAKQEERQLAVCGDKLKYQSKQLAAYCRGGGTEAVAYEKI
jgi:hypothetical protein